MANLCNICPRKCNVDRSKSLGFCGCDDKIHISKVMFHFFEEPVISGGRGSGAIFFSGCNLRCRFCQNKEISTSCNGKVYSVDELANLMISLQQKGADNINLVTATHYIDKVALALQQVKKELVIPVIYNTSGYENLQSIQALEGLVDVFLPDLKYYDINLSFNYSQCKDYFLVATLAIKEMLRQQPKVVINNGLIKNGVIIRHLVLPGHRQDSFNIIKYISQHYKTAYISLMSQYTPFFNDGEFKNLNRKITSFEYNSCLNLVKQLGINGFCQKLSSACEKYTPVFEK